MTVDAQSIAPTHGGSGGGTATDGFHDEFDYMDPALAYYPWSWQLLYATCAKLLNYPDKAGLAGSQLAPEVAQSLPARSADGRTYTFTIRRGFRFSPPSDQPVTAQTFKDTIERTLNPRMNSPFAPTLADVVGARAYMAGKASHIAGVVANGDKLTIRLLAPAPDFLSRIAQPAFCAVPSNTPDRPQRGAGHPIGRALLRGVLHARPGSRADPQPQLPRQPPAPTGADPRCGRDLTSARASPRSRPAPPITALGLAQVHHVPRRLVLAARYGPGSQRPPAAGSSTSSIRVRSSTSSC